MKKPPRTRFSPPPAILRPIIEEWHNGADVELHLYARSLQKAAKLLLQRFDSNGDSQTAWDVGPIVLLYRQATELGLKAVVGEGSCFLPSPTDHITLSKTHSIRWLAQIVGQIIKTVAWEAEFRCEGVSSLADFSALIDGLEIMEPVSCAIHANNRGIPGEIPELLRKSNVLQRIPTLDALLDLLAATADDLAATKDLMEDGTGRILKPTIH